MQLKRPVLEKVRNYMVSYFNHKMKSFVYIGQNEPYSNSEILADKIKMSGLSIQKQSNGAKNPASDRTKVSAE